MSIRDDFGIITEARERRALYGDRRSHGKARSLEQLPVAATVNPFERPKPVVRRAAPVPVPSRPPPPPPSIGANDVLAAVGAVWGVTREDLLKRYGPQRVSWARKAAYLLIKAHTPLSWDALAVAVCRRDRSIVIRNVRKASWRRERDPDWRKKYERAEAIIVMSIRNIPGTDANPPPHCMG